MLKSLRQELRRLQNSAKAVVLARFFKTGKGEYGEGDVFWGIKVPDQRAIAKKYREISLKNLRKLLLSKVHEERLTSLLILVDQYRKGLIAEKENIVNFYLKNTKNVNNWDLVDSSAPYILGEYLFNRDRSILYKLAKSENLWERRIAIIATQGFIRRGSFKDTFKIAQILLTDKHDLIHKAVGWMLREVGNRNMEAEIKFLDKHYKTMPRTMLRYAIENFFPKKRAYYLKKV